MFALLVATEKARFPKVARLFKKEGYDTLVALIADDLIAAAKSGDFTVSDPRGVAHGFVAALQGWHISSNPATDDDCIAFVSRLVTIFLTGKAGW